ncbi:MAG: hypothetical protein IM565_09615 [Pseudanabaena sp. M109S1SP2A07QC]|nr:hypothetical protein [Pseudanabaena sp. M109S1SP2A07QC]
MTAQFGSGFARQYAIGGVGFSPHKHRHFAPMKSKFSPLFLGMAVLRYASLCLTMRCDRQY